jgi:LCP family protein required for cell wall assembly
MAARKRRSARQTPNAPVRGPSRLSLLILALVGISLIVGALGFYFESQPTELAQQVLAQVPFDIPTAEPPKPPFPFVPPEESADINVRNQPTRSAQTAAPSLPTASGKLDQTLNVLLLGSDQRFGEPVWRTDVIMIAFLDTTNGRAAVLSLPRDLYVNIPTRGWDRINITDFWGEYTKYPGGGPGLMKKVIADNFGIRVDKYARVNFEGFTRIVDTLGGIDVNVPCALEDDFIDATSPTGFRHFKVDAGIQHMNGATALMFVRQRHGSGDISRAQRQQRVLYALRDKVMSPGIVTKIPQLYDQLQSVVTTDFGPLDVPRLVQIGSSIQPGNIRGRVIDETMWYFWTTPDGKSVLVFDKNKVRAAVDDLFNAPTIEESKIVCQ